MRNIKLTIEYDGTDFRGWQIQARHQRTVQGEIEKTLKKIFKHHVSLIGSGRTDSGVHALGQVANFKMASPMPTDEIVRALNANLPRDITILNAKEIPLNFHAQYSAKRKTYRYLILNRAVRNSQQRFFVFHCTSPLNLTAMRKAAKTLKGRHDFRSFMATDSADQNEDTKNTIRTIYRFTIKKHQDLLEIEIDANGFLYKMVRTIVGALLDIGKGKFPPHHITMVLQAKDRAMASSIAPARGLCLVNVKYQTRFHVLNT